MNHTTRGLLVALLGGAGFAAHAIEVPIDLTTWQKRGPAGNGTWTVASGGASVFQSINGDPTFFVSPTSQIDTTLRGKIRVETTGDDDFIGFVFGFSGPASTGNDMNYVLFDWKQLDQASGGFTAREGFSLNRVQGTITDYTPGFWGHTDSLGFDNLATNFDSTLGWADNVEYDFSILYQTGRAKVDIAGGAFGAGQTVLDVAGSFPAGAFGFYNYSQASVRYSGLTLEDTPAPPVAAIPEPETYALMLMGLAAIGLVARRRGRRA